MIKAESYIPVDTQSASDPCLACPICGDIFVHPVGVECSSPGRANGHIAIDRRGVAIDPDQPPIGRGVAIRLRFIGECGHAFNYDLQFHKGNTFVTRSMADLPRDVNSWPETIWRD